jgi:hypothetical protein
MQSAAKAQMDATLSEHARLSKEVKEIFRQASDRYEAPTPAGCAMVAFYLMALSEPRKKQRPKVARSGKAFRRDLEAERREIEWWVCVAHSPEVKVFGRWLPQQRELLHRIDQTLQNIEWMLPRLVPQDSYRDPIRQIAACAQQAWRETNNGRAPKSKKPDASLCCFVVAALRLIKQERSAETVSAVLRGRRRK